MPGLVPRSFGNRACPFGEVVQRAPGLCRMTSSVFGGIAARNAGGASVVLEERIAVGDPECRFVSRRREDDRDTARVVAPVWVHVRGSRSR